MNIRKLKKAMKNSNGFLTIGVHNHGYYAINEGNRLLFHKDYVEIVFSTLTAYKDYAEIDFSTLIAYKEINRLIIE